MNKIDMRSDATIFLTFCCVPLLLFWWAHRTLEIEAYQFKTQSAIEVQSLKPVELPLFKYIGFVRNIDKTDYQITLTPNLQANQPTPTHIYFPFRAGFVRLSHQGKVFFNGRDNKRLELPTLVSPLLVKLPDSFQIGDEIEVAVAYHNTNALRLSTAYFGSRSDFSQALESNYNYYEFIGIANIGALGFTLIFFLTLFLSGNFKQEFRPLTFLIVCMALFEIVSLESGPFFLKEYWQELLLIGPVMIASAIKYFEDFLDGDATLEGRRLLRFTAIMAGLLFAAGALFDLNLRVVNVLFSAPLMMLLCIWAGYKCIRNIGQSEKKYESMAFGATMFSFTISFFHDFSLRLGWVNDNVLLTQISFLCCFFVLATIAVLDNARSQEAIETNNKNLQEALAYQSKELGLEFKRRTLLERAQLISSEKLRFHSDLHDGVLGYLSTIHAVSELVETDSNRTIRKLSKNAINEIRVMMEAHTDEEEASLFRTCSVLRKQTIVPLESIGVDVSWDTLTLLRYHSRIPKNNMEVFRIMQEGVHNATARAKCRALHVTALQDEDGRFIIEMANSGGQTLSANNQAGKGILNMQRRAKNIGATFSLEPQDGGAILRLTLPD
jgi:signal transduction histidine kinase